LIEHVRAYDILADLLTAAAVEAGLDAGHVHYNSPPDRSKFPVILYSLVVNTDRNNLTKRHAVESEWNIEVVTESEDLRSILAIADIVDNRLTGVANYTAYGVHLMWLHRIASFDRKDEFNGIATVHVGGLYRTSIQEA